jgi:hypothetical protein
MVMYAFPGPTLAGKIGYTHVAIVYELVEATFGFGRLTPVLPLPGSEIALEASSSSGPALP